MSAANSVKIITALFTQTQRCAEQLKDCLLDELSCLKNNNAEELIKTSQLKESLMQQLGSLDNQRKELIAGENINSKEDYLLWLNKIDASGTLQEKWNEISQQIIDCQKKNATNGIITEKMTIASQEVLNILSGKNNTPSDNTYTSAGKKPANASSLHNTTA